MDGIVRVRTIAFTPDRMPMLRRIRLGYEGDNLVERLEFDLPEITAGQTATLMITGADAVTLDRTDEGRYAVDLTRDMIGPDGEREAHVRIDGMGEKVWQSAPMRMVTGALPDVEEEIEKVYPTAVGQMLTAMAEHSGEMQAQEERVEQAADRAEEAARRAENATVSGAVTSVNGKQGTVVLNAADVGAVATDELPQAIDTALAQAKASGEFDGAPGQPGKDGAPGKTAYQYAQDGGYTGTEAEFAEKLAQELPEPYTLPVATADTLGGVMIGDGLTADEAGRVSVEPEGEYELIEAFVTDKDVSVVSRSIEPDGDRYNFKKIYVDVKTPQGSEKKVGVVSLNGNNVVPIVYLNGAIVTNTEGAWCKIFAHIDGNVLRGEGQSSANGSSQLTWNNGNIYMRGFGEIGVTYIDYFQFTIISGVIPAGTVFEIYGVRAK